MEITVEKQEKYVEAKYVKMAETSNRDIIREKFEQAQRNHIQERKAAAITKFEPILVNLCQKQLIEGVLKSLATVKRPIFECEFNEYLDYQGEDEDEVFIS